MNHQRLPFSPRSSRRAAATATAGWLRLALLVLLACAAPWLPGFTPVALAGDVTPNCGGAGETACREHKPANYVSHFGCPSGTFRDPRNGGECWSCPSGYGRTARQVTHPQACAVRVRGPFSPASYHGRPKTCAGGAFHDIGRNECWSCDAGYRRTVAPVTAADACIIQARNVCDDGAHLRVLKNICEAECMNDSECGDEATCNDRGICKPSGTLVERSRRLMDQHRDLLDLLKNVVKRLGDGVILPGDLGNTLQQLMRSDEFERLMQARGGYAGGDFVISGGVAADGSVPLGTIPVSIGANLECGFALGTNEEHRLDVRKYFTAGASVGTGFGADGSLVLGVFPKQTFAEFSGEAHGVVMGASDGGGLAVAVWWNHEGELLGFTMSPQGGVSVELEYNRVHTSFVESPTPIPLFTRRNGEVVEIGSGVALANACEAVLDGSPTFLENVALGRRTTQSSTAVEGASSRAVDGNKNGNWSVGSTTHTANEEQPWWQVDLGLKLPIAKVRIANREDCCTARLHDFVVEVLDDSGNVVDEVFHQGTPRNHVQDVAFDFAVGRYVRVRLTTGGILSLAEVEVFTELSKH